MSSTPGFSDYKQAGVRVGFFFLLDLFCSSSEAAHLLGEKRHGVGLDCSEWGVHFGAAELHNQHLRNTLGRVQIACWEEHEGLWPLHAYSWHPAWMFFVIGSSKHHARALSSKWNCESEWMPIKRMIKHYPPPQFPFTEASRAISITNEPLGWLCQRSCVVCVVETGDSWTYPWKWPDAFTASFKVSTTLCSLWFKAWELRPWRYLHCH